MFKILVLISAVLIATFAEGSSIALRNRSPNSGEGADRAKDDTDGQVAFIGGSIMAYYDWDGMSTWSIFYNTLKSKRRAVLHAKTAGIIDAINSKGLLDNLDPYLSVVLAGETDVRDDIPEEEIIANIKEIVRLVGQKLKNSRILLLGLFPQADAEKHQKIRDINVQLLEFAESSGLYYADIEETLSTGLGELRPTYYWGDGIHLGNMGYRRWAFDMEDVFNRALSAPYLHKTVFLGDSQTGGWLTNGLSVWNKDFAGLNATNVNIGNLGTDALISKIRIDGLLDEFTHTKEVVLMIGSHDLSYGLSFEHVANNTKKIVDLVLQGAPRAKILLLSLLPRAGVAVDAQTELVNQLIEKYAIKDKVAVINSRKLFQNELGSPIKQLYDQDLFHLTAAGYQVLSNSMSTPFNKLLQFDTYSNLNPSSLSNTPDRNHFRNSFNFRNIEK